MDPIPECEPILGSAAMREADRLTIETVGLPGTVLMETAGRAVASLVLDRYGVGPGGHVVVACGQGNNGGDGFVVARVLHAAGARVTVLTVGDPAGRSPHSSLHAEALARLASVDPRRIVLVDARVPSAVDDVMPCDVVVDALLGIGQTAAPRSPLDAIVRWMNGTGRPVVAVDVATGLDSDTGAAYDPCVRADVTVTMGAVKVGSCIADGPAVSGEVVTAEIGIPEHVIVGEARAGGAFRSTDRAVRTLLDAHPRHGHKYTTGPALVAAGSARYAGAPVLSSRAAGRAGCGYVLCAAPGAVAPRIAAAIPEVPFVELPSTGDGQVDGVAAAGTLLGAAQRVRALLLGPGLGRGPSVSAFVRSVLERWTGPVVIDADALNALDPDFLAAHGCDRWILTPHSAEFERLGGPPFAGSTVVTRAARAAAAWNCVVLLKGYPSVVAAPDRPVVVCSTGNPALATAGTGDVLAGLCVGLVARGLDGYAAAIAAVHLGGAAADRYSVRSGRSSMSAGDLLVEIGPTIRERFE